MAKKPAKKIARKDADQYMLRLPDGLRDRVARRAAENGRSMNTEIIDAIEKYLEGTDRISQLWESFEQHRENIEAIVRIWDAVEELEGRLQKFDSGRGVLTEWRYDQEKRRRREESPFITPGQVEKLNAEITELGLDATKLLDRLRIPAKAIGQIKDSDMPEVKGLLSLLRDQMRKNPPA